MKTIVVNNPAAIMSGALNILKQFLSSIEKYDTKNNYIVFVALIELKKFESDNVKIIVIPPQNFLSRLAWDNIGFKRYLKINAIHPDVIISLQNTGLNYTKSIPQILYFHQGLTVTTENCSIFDKEDRQFWFYKNIYPLFVNQYLKKVTNVVVQTTWVKDAFVKRFHYPAIQVLVVPPEFRKPDIKTKRRLKKDELFSVFYPAGPSKYKNHKVLINSLNSILSEYPELEHKLECIFTFDKDENVKLYNFIVEKKLDNIIKFVGRTSYEQTLNYYQNSDLLVFPSYIETYGLPLKEAAYFGMPIVATNKPYAIEVLEEYKHVTFVEHNKVSQWASAIFINYQSRVKRTPLIEYGNKSSWRDLFDLI